MNIKEEINIRIKELELWKKQDPSETYFYNQEIKKLKNLKSKKKVYHYGDSILKTGKRYTKSIGKIDKKLREIPKLKGVPKGRRLY